MATTAAAFITYGADPARTDTRSYAERLIRELDGVELDSLHALRRQAEKLTAAARGQAAAARTKEIGARLIDFADGLDALVHDELTGGAIVIAERREAEPV